MKNAEIGTAKKLADGNAPTFSSLPYPKNPQTPQSLAAVIALSPLKINLLCFVVCNAKSKDEINLLHPQNYLI